MNQENNTVSKKPGLPYRIFSNFKFQLLILFISGLTLRIYYTPLDIPITLDGAQYFWYAIDTSILGELPNEYNFPNNGWPVFLSLIFNIVNPDTFLDFHITQRLSSIILSTATIIPIYLICRKFFDSKIAFIGSVIFVFEPRLLLNSIIGLPEALFILLFTSSIYLFLSKNFKKVYIAFALIALLSLIRYEGFLLIFPFSILLFFRFGFAKKNILKYVLAIGIFILILLPAMYIRSESSVEVYDFELNKPVKADGVVSHVVVGAEFFLFEKENTLVTQIANGVTNMTKFIGWQMIPYLFFFIPFGIIYFFKNFNLNKKIIFICTVIMLIPAFYAYSREFNETKYLFVMMPLMSVMASSFIEKLITKTTRKNLVICLLIIGIILSAIIFLEYQKVDYKHEAEAYQIGIKISEITDIINDYDPESRYVNEKIAEATILDEFPMLFSNVPKDITVIQGASGGKTAGCDICYEAKSLGGFLDTARSDGLEYLLVDDNPRRPEFIKDVIDNEHEYPFLEKIYDSKDDGLTYHVKIFKIDYEKFDDERK